MNILKFGLVGILLAYIATAFGKVAAKHGKNPILYGLLSIISPINLIILGYWAFSDFETGRRP
jgi:hypothetical protein